MPPTSSERAATKPVLICQLTNPHNWKSPVPTCNSIQTPVSSSQVFSAHKSQATLVVYYTTKCLFKYSRRSLFLVILKQKFKHYTKLTKLLQIALHFFISVWLTEQLGLLLCVLLRQTSSSSLVGEICYLMEKSRTKYPDWQAKTLSSSILKCGYLGNFIVNA